MGLFVLESLNAYFKTTYCKTVKDTGMSYEDVAQIADCPLPSIYQTDFGFQKLVITHDRRVVATEERDQAARALILQFASLSIYDVSVQEDNKGDKLSENIRNYWTFISVYFFGI